MSATLPPDTERFLLAAMERSTLVAAHALCGRLAWDAVALLTAPYRDIHGRRAPARCMRMCHRQTVRDGDRGRGRYSTLQIARRSAGTSWRCGVTPASNVQMTHGALAAEFSRHTAMYVSPQGNEYFGCADAHADTARELASKFVERFPDIAGLGRGPDWAYAGWYVEMLGHADRGALPVAYDDWYDAPDPRWLPTTEGVASGLPMPPGGEAVRSAP